MFILVSNSVSTVRIHCVYYYLFLVNITQLLCKCWYVQPWLYVANTYILLHDWEANTGRYSVHWPYWPD